MKNNLKDHLKILGQQKNQNSFQTNQQQFNDRQQIQQLRYTLKNLYFQKRKAMVDTLIQMLQQNKRPSQSARNLRLPDNIQQQREQTFIIDQNFKRRKFINQQQNGSASYVFKQEPFSKVKQKIIAKYKLKRQYSLEMRNKLAQEDNLETQKKIIQEIYKTTLRNCKFINDQSQEYQNSYDWFDKNSLNLNYPNKLKNRIKMITDKQITNRTPSNIQKIYADYDTLSSIKKINKADARSSPSNKKMQQSIVIQRNLNPAHKNYMRIDDPYIGFDSQSNQYLKDNSNKILPQSFQEQQKNRNINEKKINSSFQQSGYKHFLNAQKRQLEQQKKRMQKLTQQANRAMKGDSFQQSEESNKSHNFGSKDFQSIIENSISLDQGSIELNQIKYLFNQLIELFILSQVTKYHLHYRTFEILSKLYQQASKYYNESIELSQPINSNTFLIIIKAILNSQNQLRSQIDVVVNNVFQGKNQINFEQFNSKFNSILNQKQIKLFEPSQIRQQLDKTMQKTKRLFIIWIQMDYFSKKIKTTLRKKPSIASTIVKQCSQNYDSQNLNGQLLGQFFSLNYNSHAQKIKVDTFFRHVLGNDLKRVSFIQWYSNDNNYMFSSRYQRIGARLNKKQIK